MRFRLRLALSFLIMAMFSFALLAFQANLIFTRQLKPVNESTVQALEVIDSGKVDQGEVAQFLRENQARYDQALVSIRYSLVILTVILLIVMVGLGISFAIHFSTPFERIASRANDLLQVVQRLVPLRDAHSENVETVDGIHSNREHTIMKEESLISSALDVVTSFIKEEYAELKENLRKQTEKNKALSDQLIDLEQFIHETTEAFDVKYSLNEMTQRISQRFRSSFVGIYLMDESRQFVELKAAYYSENDPRQADGPKVSSQPNFKKNFRIIVNEAEKSGEGIVGHAAAAGEIFQTDGSHQFAQVLPNDEISSARFETALPIRMRGVVMGVLDIISKSTEPFPPEEMAILHVYADQIALVNEFDTLFSNQTFDTARSVYGDMTRQAWDELMQGRSEWGYRSDEKGIHRTEGEWLPWMIQAIQSGQVVYWQEEDSSIASVPIRVRDYILGALDFRKEGDSAWTSEEVVLAQTLTDQLGQALESARLYQNTQLRAERERVLTDITSKVRASTNVDVILQTAIRELAEALRVPKGSIQLRSYTGEGKERRYPSTSGGQGNA